MEVKLENLTKIFTGKKGETTVAVDKMTFTIPDGKLVGLLGPSGCGKSTTLYMIAGLHKPTGGKIFFGDVDVTNVPPENRGIGLVFQNYALYPHFTVRGNILFPLENVKDYIDPETKVARRYTKAEMNVIAEKMASLVDIKPYLERKPKQLSGGQQQRVAIARALAKSPRVLLLDEPLSNLDARLRLQTREEIKRIQRETGITTIFVTHDQEEAMSISDFIVVMDKGVVQQIDEPQKVYNEPVNLFVAKFLGSPAINMLEGEIRSGNLYLGDKIFDKGYEAKGNLALDSKEVYSLLSANGYKGTFEEYDALVHGTITIPSEEDKKKMVTLPFELTIENIVNATKKQGLLLDAKSLSYKIEELKVTGKHNRKAFIGIRPEAFVIDETNPFKIPVKVEYIEHIGRDISLIGKTEKDAKLRIIIPSDLSSKATAGTVKFSVKRFFVFETTGVRVK